MALPSHRSYNPAMRPLRLPLVTGLLALSLTAVASDAFIAPGVRLAVINTPHLHALVPAHAAEALKAKIARAEVIYAAMAKDAGYTPRKLVLLVTDDLDTHNGFSTTVPFPIINVQLAPSLQPSFIFTGDDEFERTLVHELAHHISNDFDPNTVRRTMSNIFGRVLPFDYLSLLVSYLSVPSHVTMPSFWHEGTAQWAETEYATSPVWGGRGRDSMTHMVWRMDALAGKIPEVGDWRLSFQEWPFGSNSYLYGVAYTRWLAGNVGQRASMWQLIERQQHRWPFAFNGGPQKLLGTDHLSLIDTARRDLLAEQQRNIATLKSKPITVAKRLTPVESTVGAPAWTKDGELFAAWNGPYGDPRFITVDATGDNDNAGYRSWMMSPARSLSDGTLVFSDADVTTDPWNRSRVSIVWPDGDRTRVPYERLLQPDVCSTGSSGMSFVDDDEAHQIAAIHLKPDGTHELVVCNTAIEWGLLWNSRRFSPLSTVSTEGRPWSPVFMPQPPYRRSRQFGSVIELTEPMNPHVLTWVETDAAGSRLVAQAIPVDRKFSSIRNNVEIRQLKPRDDAAHLPTQYDHKPAIDPGLPPAPPKTETTDDSFQVVLAPARNSEEEQVPPAPATVDGLFIDSLGNQFVPVLALDKVDSGKPDRSFPARTVLVQLPGRILHPTWSADGKYLYFCADHTGVANAYRFDPDTKELLAITNTLGGVLACVPSPDGKELAIVDHDDKGSFLARIPNDPATWPGTAPKISLTWPAPVGKNANPDAKVEARFTLPEDRGDPAALTVEPYRGLLEIRPLFWTPTLAAVPEGGLGIAGLMADPVFTHLLIGSAGIGLAEASPVGLASWAYGGWPIDIGIVGWQAERSYDEQIVASDGNLYDYVEVRRSAEFRLGHGLTGLRRRFQLYAAAGIAEYDTVDSAAEEYDGLATFNLTPFTKVEQYTEFTLAYSDATVFPTSYTLEDGTSFAVSYRHSGYGGDLKQDRVIGLGTYVLSFWPRFGQQLVFGGALGWTEGDEFLQNQFSVGGTYGLNQLPRGYGTTEALGQYLVGGSVAYRTPVWRPFWGHSTTPFVDRQTVLELFFDAAKVSNEELDGDDGEWFRSVGANIHMNWMVWELMLSPGIGVAQQLDGDEATRVLFGFDFIW